MTTLACDGRVVAADGQMSDNGTIIEMDCKKIIVKGARIFAVVGWYGALEPISNWIVNGANVEKLPKINEFHVLELCENQAFLYSHDIPYPDPYNYPCAFGSGKQYALAVMHLGYGAVEAVKAAIALDPDTGGEITRIDLTPATDDHASARGNVWIA